MYRTINCVSSIANQIPGGLRSLSVRCGSPPLLSLMLRGQKTQAFAFHLLRLTFVPCFMILRLHFKVLKRRFLRGCEGARRTLTFVSSLQ